MAPRLKIEQGSYDLPLPKLACESEQQIYTHLTTLGVCPVDAATYLRDCRNNFDEKLNLNTPTLSCWSPLSPCIKKHSSIRVEVSNFKPRTNALVLS